MSNSRRVLVIVVAVAAAVIALIVLKPGDDSTDEPSQITAPTGATGSTGATGPEAVIKPKSEPVPIVRVRDGRPIGGPLEIRVKNGERIRFRVSSDSQDQVHVHGFNLEKAVVPGKSIRFSFSANIEGAFEVEMHGSGAIVAEIQVRPR